MNKYCIGIEIEDGEIKRILDQLTEAQETIQRCYDELNTLGVVTIKEKIVSGD